MLEVYCQSVPLQEGCVCVAISSVQRLAACIQCFLVNNGFQWIYLKKKKKIWQCNPERKAVRSRILAVVCECYEK